jgi:hypothetical protein
VVNNLTVADYQTFSVGDEEIWVHNCPSSRVLGRALEAAGHFRPPSSAAHHIVAGTAKIAADARAALRRFGIALDDAVNGVFLPAT